jgi:hypothetical protein
MFLLLKCIMHPSSIGAQSIVQSKTALKSKKLLKNKSCKSDDGFEE